MNFDVSPQLAEAIINECKARKVYDGSMPSTGEGKIKIAVGLLEHAYVAKKSQPKLDQDVKAIITMYENKESFEDQSIDDKGESLENDSNIEELDTKETVIEDVSEKSLVTVEKDHDHLLNIVKEIEKENLPINVELQDNPPELPSDWTIVDDLSLRRLYSQYNAANIRMSWILNIEESKLYDLERAAKIRLTQVINTLDKVDAKGKPKQSTMLKEEAAIDTEYIDWLEKSADCRRRCRSFKTLNEGYEKICERISREWTMRTSMYDKGKS